MEATLQSMDILLQIERQICYRIECLSQKQDRLLINKLVLRKQRELTKALLFKNKQAEKSIKEDKPLPLDDCISNFGELDGILNLAKEIRAGATKTGRQADRTRTESRQTLRDALSLAKTADVKPDTDVVAPRPSREEQLLNDLHEQLLFLTRYRIALPVAKLYMNRTKYSNESKLLSKLFTYPVQPRSTLFRTIYPTLPTTAPESPTAPLSYVVRDSVVVKLAQQFKNLVVQYDRHLKQRINHESYKVSQLSADEKRAMVTMWMRGRKLMELYQHYVKTKQKLQCTCEACSLARRTGHARSDTAISTLNHATPSYTPLPSPSATTEQDIQTVKVGAKSNAKTKNSAGSAPSVWASASKTRVEAFHDAYQSKVLLIAESAVGQEQLKGSIQALKSCCEDSAARAKLGEKGSIRPEADSGFVSKWVESLKQFRLVYSLLLNEAQELNHCIFINKT